MISVTVILSGGVRPADIESAQEFVEGLTGGEAKISRSPLAPHQVMVGATGPGHAVPVTP